MALNLEKRNKRFLLFLKIELPTETLRFCQEDIAAEDIDGNFYFWSGRLSATTGDIALGFSGFRNSNAYVSSVGVNLFAGNDVNGNNINDLIDKPVGLATATIYLADESTVTTIAQAGSLGHWRAGPSQFAGPSKRVGNAPNYVAPQLESYEAFILNADNILFRGKISFPDFITSMTEDSITFSIYDDRYLDDVKVTPLVFREEFITDTSSEFRGIGPGVEGRTIPVVYGDFSDNPTVDAYLMAGFDYADDYTYKIADDSQLGTNQKAIKSIEFVLNDFSEVTTASEDLTAGEFDVDRTNVEPEKSVKVSVEGRTRGDQIASVFGGSATDLLEKPAEVIYDILINIMGVDTTRIDESSFTTLIAGKYAGMKCRRWITAPLSAREAIDQIAFEFGFNLIGSVIGKFKLKDISFLDSNSTAIALDQDDMTSDEYQITVDTNRQYFNKFNGLINLDDGATPVNFDYSSKIVEHGKTFEFSHTFLWNYSDLWSIETMSKLASIFARPLREIQFRSFFRTLTKVPTDFVDLTYHIYSNSLCFLRETRKDLSNFTSFLKLWDISYFDFDLIADNASSFASYSAAESSNYANLHAAHEIIEGVNDIFAFDTDADYEATLTPGYYDADEMATLIQNAANAVSTSVNLTVTYSSSTRKFTIATDDMSNFELNWTDSDHAKEIGRSVLGFDTASDDTGANSYTGDYIAVFDVDEGEAVSHWL